jgi:hypothetical protein
MDINIKLKKGKKKVNKKSHLNLTEVKSAWNITKVTQTILDKKQSGRLMLPNQWFLAALSV